MPKKNYTINVGDFVVGWIVGDVNHYIAEVIKSTPLRVKIIENGPYANVGNDFVLLEGATEMLQADCRNKTNNYLEEVQKNNKKVYSGLKKMGVTDNQLHEILPG